MHKMASNIIAINKIILFIENIINEDVEGDYFSEKINFDLNFTINCMQDLWMAYLKYTDSYEKEDFLKNFNFSLKRLYKVIIKIINNDSIKKNFKITDLFLNNYIQTLKDKMEMISEHKSRATLVNTKEQCINEEEYNMLFSDKEEENK